MKNLLFIILLASSFCSQAQCLGDVYLRQMCGVEAPNGRIRAVPGETYQQKATQTVGAFWIKATGNNTNTGWVAMPTSVGAAGWNLTGNAGTVPGTNFVGTTDSVDFVVKSDATEAVRVRANGNVGIGVSAPASKLDVSGTAKILATAGSGATTEVLITTAAFSATRTFNSGSSRNQLFVRESGIGLNTGVNDGSVGIGVIDPFFKFNVVGSSCLRAGDVPMSGDGSSIKNEASRFDIELTTHTGYRSAIFADTVSKKLSVFNNNTDTSQSVIAIDSIGSVGIGTPTPERKIDILGNGRFKVGVPTFGNGVGIDWDVNFFSIELSTDDGYRCYMGADSNSKVLTIKNNQNGSGEASINVWPNADVCIGCHGQQPAANLEVDSSFVYKDGNQAADKVMASDADGLASWQHPDSLLPYRKYVAFLSQAGTNNPVVTVFENTLGASITWARSGVGNYTGTIDNGFDISKFWMVWGPLSFNQWLAYSIGGGILVVDTYNNGGTTHTDDALLNTSIEIRVYK